MRGSHAMTINDEGAIFSDSPFDNSLHLGHRRVDSIVNSDRSNFQVPTTKKYRLRAS